MSLVYALMLIPALSLLNHLGGQSTRIPYPRVICRMIGMPLAITCTALLMKIPANTCAMIVPICFAGISFWAVWKNGPEFMSITGWEKRDYTTPWYTPNMWITKLCDICMEVSQLTTLTPAQCKEWGTLYGTFLGCFMYPLFLGLAWGLTPWAACIGIVCTLQGVVYRFSGLVLDAEYIMGAFIGSAMASIIIIYKIYG